MKLPIQTGEIFHRLSKGKFICANSLDPDVRKMYDVISEGDHFEILRTYFSHIYFDLEQGNQFYYFTRRETKVNLENKIKAALKWILIVDFFVTYDSSFSWGYCFNTEDILSKYYIDSVLRHKITVLTNDSEGKPNEKIESMIQLLIDDNFVEVQPAENVKKYKVLNSFEYLQNLILNIHISKETQDELS
jgi:hypothetical protein